MKFGGPPKGGGGGPDPQESPPPPGSAPGDTLEGKALETEGVGTKSLTLAISQCGLGVLFIL